MPKADLKNLPAIHVLQSHSSTIKLMQEYQIDLPTMTIYLKKQLTKMRNEIIHNKTTVTALDPEKFMDYFFQELVVLLDREYAFRMKKVINASGTVLHTNLGRARLSDSAIDHVVDVAKHYSNLELELASGKRGSRHTHVEALLISLTGAEAAMVVNNNAAAVYLVLAALSKGKEVIVSRGELVEIGGSFRISSIMEESGAVLKEVGTTNKTHLHDYEAAISEETAMLLKVHTSNFQVIGFTASVPSQDLFQLAKENRVISYEDLGSGALFDFSKYGIGSEPLVSDVIANGVDIASFSGDKLLGGPQAGIIVGEKHLIDQLKKHQLARVLRVDKMTLAALEATLMTYAKGQEAVVRDIPTVRDIVMSAESVKEKTLYFLDLLKQEKLTFDYDIAEDASAIGGGTMPGVTVKSNVIGFKFAHLSAQTLHDQLRTGQPAIIGKINQDMLWLDLRTVTKSEINEIVQVLKQL